MSSREAKLRRLLREEAGNHTSTVSLESILAAPRPGRDGRGSADAPSVSTPSSSSPPTPSSPRTSDGGSGRWLRVIGAGLALIAVMAVAAIAFAATRSDDETPSGSDQQAADAVAEAEQAEEELRAAMGVASALLDVLGEEAGSLEELGLDADALAAVEGPLVEAITDADDTIGDLDDVLDADPDAAEVSSARASLDGTLHEAEGMRQELVDAWGTATTEASTTTDAPIAAECVVVNVVVTDAGDRLIGPKTSATATVGSGVVVSWLAGDVFVNTGLELDLAALPRGPSDVSFTGDDGSGATCGVLVR